MRVDRNDLAVRWMVRVVLTLSFPGLAAASAQSAPAGGHPTADEILRRVATMNRERLAALEHYTTHRTYRVVYNGTGGYHEAQLKVLAEYDGPEQKHFTVESESGSKIIAEKVLHKLVESEQEAGDRANRAQSALTSDNYKGVLTGEETFNLPDTTPVKTWVLHVEPRSPARFNYTGTVWISEDDYAVVRIDGAPAKSPSWWIDSAHIDSRYVRRGQIWLPANNTSASHVRIGGQATLTIDYGSYPEVLAKDVPAHL